MQCPLRCQDSIVTATSGPISARCARFAVWNSPERTRICVSGDTPRTVWPRSTSASTASAAAPAMSVDTTCAELRGASQLLSTRAVMGVIRRAQHSRPAARCRRGSLFAEMSLAVIAPTTLRSWSRPAAPHSALDHAPVRSSTLSPTGDDRVTRWKRSQFSARISSVTMSGKGSSLRVACGGESAQGQKGNLATWLPRRQVR